jgi:hypothetical protein
MNNTPIHIAKPPHMEKTKNDELVWKFDQHIISKVEQVGYIESSELLWTYERKDLASHMTSEERMKFWEVVDFLSKRQRIIKVYRPLNNDDYEPTVPYSDEFTVYFCSPKYVSKMVFPEG